MDGMFGSWDEAKEIFGHAAVGRDDAVRCLPRKGTGEPGPATRTVNLCPGPDATNGQPGIVATTPAEEESEVVGGCTLPTTEPNCLAGNECCSDGERVFVASGMNLRLGSGRCPAP